MTHPTDPDYPTFPPIPHLHREVVITELVDGVHGLVEVTPLADFNGSEQALRLGIVVRHNDAAYIVRAGGRDRWLTRDTDNLDFAHWVYDNAADLAALGPGRHRGAWFGKGIRSGYGLEERRFALLDTARWYDPRNPYLPIDTHPENFPQALPAPEVVTVVPILTVDHGRFLSTAVEIALHNLQQYGSYIAPGFDRPEGIVLHHTAAGTYFKVAFNNDPKHKTQVNTA